MRCAPARSMKAVGAGELNFRASLDYSTYSAAKIGSCVSRETNSSPMHAVDAVRRDFGFLGISEIPDALTRCSRVASFLNRWRAII
ncbi:hypothetical protein WT27_28005 [Burkholderia territorii]|uniref:Uncharacterized protein n=1 Tax=Burkholderia territorii TaxID=1503055 RepID=A0A106E3U1_9BURK|nr:hypothetical protein WT27_28005 [Burkholderia territorii]KVX40484.1 hypothetical protein WT31_31050 [Burkholderia territorii]